MFYAKDSDDQFVYSNNDLLLADDWSTMCHALKEMGLDAENGVTIHEFDLLSLLMMRDSVTHLRRYLMLPKFQGIGNDYVNVNDIRDRLNY